MKNRVLIVFVSVFLAIVLSVGGVLGISVALKNARAVVRYENVTADEGAVRYLASYYKMLYLRSLNSAGISAFDGEEFWNSISEEGKSYGEHFEEGFREYLASLIAANNIFLSYSKYTPEDKYRVAATVEEILKYKANNSVSDFNSMAEPYGFDHDDFSNAAALLYKAERAKEILYGINGENLKSFPEECAKYYETYSHVSLIFIRTEQVFEYDEEGKLVYDEEGNVRLRDLTEDERAERQGIIDTLTCAIEAKKNGENMQITPTMFENFLAKSDSDKTMNDVGYYFHGNANATREFAEAFPEVVEASLAMDKYEYRRVDCSIGVCFIYKYDLADKAYSDSDNVFFSDFYSDASDYLYGDIIETLSDYVAFSDSYGEIDLLSIPVIKDFYIREWKD